MAVATPDSRHAFDPVRVGRSECDAWASYYRHEWPTFLRAALGMVRAGFGMSRRSTVRGAWYVLRANQAWAPYPDNDPDAARELMRRFYALAAGSGDHRLDPAHASILEVEWWRVHRERQHDSSITADELVDALNALYAYVYDAPPELTRRASELRVEAMDLSDEWVERGCHLDDPLLNRERRTLVASYSALRDAADRRAAGAPGSQARLERR
jgi:hypothetical protein